MAVVAAAIWCGLGAVPVRPAAHVSASRIAHDLQHQGYSCIERAVSRSVVSAARSEWERILADEPTLIQLCDYASTGGIRGATHGGKGTRLEAALPYSPHFAALALLDGPIRDGVESAMGEAAFVDMAVVIESREGSDDQRFHTDLHLEGTPYEAGAQGSPLGAGVVVAVPLVDIQETNGPFECLPATHTWPKERIGALFNGADPAYAPAGAESVVFAPLSAGSAIVYARNLLHRGRANRCSAPRPTAFFSLVPRRLLDAAVGDLEQDYLGTFPRLARRHAARWLVSSSRGGLAFDPRACSAVRRRFWRRLAERHQSSELKPETLRETYEKLRRLSRVSDRQLVLGAGMSGNHGDAMTRPPGDADVLDGAMACRERGDDHSAMFHVFV